MLLKYSNKNFPSKTDQQESKPVYDRQINTQSISTSDRDANEAPINQTFVLNKLDHASEHIKISYDVIKSLNSEDKDYNTLRYYLKMSLLLLERAGNALQDSLTVLEEKNLVTPMRHKSD